MVSDTGYVLNNYQPLFQQEFLVIYIHKCDETGRNRTCAHCATERKNEEARQGRKDIERGRSEQLVQHRT